MTNSTTKDAITSYFDTFIIEHPVDLCSAKQIKFHQGHKSTIINVHLKPDFPTGPVKNGISVMAIRFDFFKNSLARLEGIGWTIFTEVVYFLSASYLSNYTI